MGLCGRYARWLEKSTGYAAGSGAAVATDILTIWNNGKQTHEW
jgi:hypothetical protein